MNDATPTDADAIRARSAAEEREAILEIIERHARLFSHGHGVNAGQVLHAICEEVRRRGEAETDAPPA